MKMLQGFARRFGARSGLFALLAAALALLPLLLAVQPLAAQSPAAQSPAAQSETRLRFSLDRSIDGTAAPFFLALDRGYFKAEGLDVTIDAAATPQDAITRLAIATGAAEPTHDMSIGDINALIRYRDQNPPTGIEAVFMVHDKPAYALVGRRSRGVQAPKDVEGKRIAAPMADPGAQLWGLFARLNGIDTGKVEVLNVGLQVRGPMLASGEVDASIGNSFTVFVDLKDRSVPAEDIVVLLMADYGLSLYGSAILASAKFQAEQPEAIRGFLRAFAKALQETMADPAAAVESVVKHVPGARKEIELERLQILLTQNVKKFDPKAETVGDVDPVRFAGSIEQIGMVYAFKNKLKPEQIFDAQYLPPPPPAAPAQRKGNNRKKR